MNPALLFTLSLFALPAFADDEPIEPPKPLPTLSTDLDMDGKPDSVRILPGNEEHEVLEIQYTSSGKSFRYENLVRHFSNTTCSRMGYHELEAGPERTIRWTVNTGTMDECRSESRTTFELAPDVNRTDIRVQKAEVYYHSWSMGGPRPTEYTTYDFIGRTLEMEVQDGSSGPKMKSKENLRPGCVATLGELNKQGGGLPMCAAVQAHFLNLELYAQAEKNLRAVCPEFQGSFVCERKYSDGDAYKTRVLVIYRTEGKYNRYDISDHSRLWIADGRKHKMSRWENDNTVVVTTCRRDIISTTEESWLKLGENDNRKPLYDRFPVSRELITWAQQDVEGQRFHYEASTEYLNEDGTYRKTAPTTMECVKEKNPE